MIDAKVIQKKFPTLSRIKRLVIPPKGNGFINWFPQRGESFKIIFFGDGEVKTRTRGSEEFRTSNFHFKGGHICQVDWSDGLLSFDLINEGERNLTVIVLVISGESQTKEISKEDLEASFPEWEDLKRLVIEPQKGLRLMRWADEFVLSVLVLSGSGVVCPVDVLTSQKLVSCKINPLINKAGLSDINFINTGKDPLELILIKMRKKPIAIKINAPERLGIWEIIEQQYNGQWLSSLVRLFSNCFKVQKSS